MSTAEDPWTFPADDPFFASLSADRPADVVSIHHARSASRDEESRYQRNPLDLDQMVQEQLVRLQAVEIAKREFAKQQAAAGFDPFVAELEEQERRLKARLAVQEKVAAETEARRTGAGLGDLDLAGFVNGEEFIYGADAELEPIWGTGEATLWAAGEAMMIHGPQGLGKTTIAQQLVKALVGLRDEVLGFPVTPATGKVLYLAMDRPRQAARAMKRLFASCTPEERVVLKEHLVVWKGPLPAPLLSRPALLRDMARAKGCSVVFVNSLKDAVGKLSDDEHGANYNTAIQMCLVAGIQVCDLHHPRKASADNASKPKGVDDIFGSTWLTAGHGSIVNLWGKTGDLVVELSMLKLVNDEVGPLQVVHDHELGESHVQGQFDMLQALAVEGQMTAQRAAILAFDGLTKPNDVQKARRKLQGLVGKEFATETPGTRGGAPLTWHVTQLGRDVAAKTRSSAPVSESAERAATGFGGGRSAWSGSGKDPF